LQTSPKVLLELVGQALSLLFGSESCNRRNFWHLWFTRKFFTRHSYLVV